jgi:hypothetical protein
MITSSTFNLKKEEDSSFLPKTIVICIKHNYLLYTFNGTLRLRLVIFIMWGKSLVVGYKVHMPSSLNTEPS